MAIWQYRFNIIPKGTEDHLIPWENEEGPEVLFCWQQINIDINILDGLEVYLPKIKSWNEKIIQFGELDSHCIEATGNGNIIEGISFRIDYRDKCYTVLLNKICSFCINNEFLILDEYFNIIPNFSTNKLSELIENSEQRKKILFYFQDNLL